MDYTVKSDPTSGATEDVTDEGTSKERPKRPDSKLDKRIQDLIEIICDITSMEDTMMEMKYDTKKAPLGKLSTEQIKAGYAALKKVEECMEKSDFGKNLVEACNDFYTRIPHYFGMKTPPLIRTKEALKAELQLLEALDDIEIAMKIIKHSSAVESPIDTHYKDLKCDIKPVGTTDDMFKIINDYLQSTHAATHNHYKMEILDLYEVNKHDEMAAFKDCGNRHLLWHGSRLTNWLGILSKGLRIAPPEAPVTGYMFGKGIYFADISSKSANYCFATKSKNLGLLLLCDVALGNTNDLLSADYAADKLPKGKNSVRGLGKWVPDSSKHITLPDGVIVPMGKCKDTGIDNAGGYTLNYNEFIVYNTNQVRLRYLCKIQFNFK